MKPLIIAFTLLASVMTNTTFAGEEKVSPVVLQSFQSTFNVQQVSWTFSNNLYKAQFDWNGSVVTAFYNTEGTLIATTRSITVLQIPVTLQTALKKNYSQFWITDLLEVANDDGTSYYIMLENADTKVILRSSGHTHWSMYQKSSK